MRHWCLAAVLVPGAALAHGGDANLLPWSFEAWVVAPLAVFAGLFTLGMWRLRGRSEHGGARRRQSVLFAAGWLITALALTSPLHAAGSFSFAAHMVEHELLMLAGAPLLVLGRPLPVMLWAFPHGIRRPLGRAVLKPVIRTPWLALTSPVAATALQALALWLWHAPALFGLALASERWHVVQHLSFVLTALLFWSAMLEDGRLRRNAMAAVGALFFTALVSGALGALMAFSASPWYAGYAALGITPFGLTPVQDQQLAGLLMWIPGGLVHAGAALAIVARLLAATRGDQA
jgi:cytochrome c oxidase assembly factor CtaG